MLAIDAEAALFAVGEVRADLPRPRKFSWRSWSKVASRGDRLRMELAYPRFIGAMENYLVMHLTRSVKSDLLEEVAPPDPLDDETKRLRSAVRNFGTLMKMWADDLGVELPKLETWADVLQCREIRHVLIHRLGRWEPGLDPKGNLELRLASLGRNPKTFRGEFPLSREDCADCADLVIKAVTEVEAQFGRA